MLNFQSKEVQQLLHNKFVVILGDSIQRSVYKDLIRLLQNDSLLSSSQMKSKLRHLSESIRNDVIEGNFYGATLASLHFFDVLDLHFHFRHDLGNRVKDGVHWNNVVHRRITNLLLAHVADAWGVVIPDTKSHRGSLWNKLSVSSNLPTSLMLPFPLLPQPPRGGVHEDFFFCPNASGASKTNSGVTCFTDSHFPPFWMDVALNSFQDNGAAAAAIPDPNLLQLHPSCSKENISLHSRRRKRRARGTKYSHDLVMRSKPFWQTDFSPYKRAPPKRSRDTHAQRARR
uniref:Uncharacterized protein n=1 Tax=Sphaerodactylus townsendi TaxID=933632 RepID=A0ACB8E9I0_9SAUR